MSETTDTALRKRIEKQYAPLLHASLADMSDRVSSMQALLDSVRGKIRRLQEDLNE